MDKKLLHEELLSLGIKHKDKLKLINHALYYCKINTKKFTDEEYKKLSKEDKIEHQKSRKNLFMRVHYQWKLAALNLKKEKINIVEEGDFKDFVMNKLKLTNIF